MIEPFAAMQAACIAIAAGEANEIEMEWTENVGDAEQRLTIFVRREVKHFTSTMPTD